MRLSVEEINFGVEVQRICENFYPLAEERHIHFSVEDHSHGAILWADKEKLETILSNLLSNLHSRINLLRSRSLKQMIT